MTATKGPSKSDRAYAWLYERILSHEYSPGYRLVLSSIADELGMSVVPVRDAIRRLNAQRLVTFEHNVGARVALVDEGQYLDTMQALGIIEGAAISLAAPVLRDGARAHAPRAPSAEASTAETHAGDEDATVLERAERVNAEMHRLLARFDPVRFTELNREFHTLLFECCPNGVLVDEVRRGWVRLSSLRDSTFSFVPDRARRSVEEHDEMLRLISEGADPLDIELAVRRHRWRTANAYAENVSDQAAHRHHEPQSMRQNPEETP